jgi:hypothetical protein
MASLTLLLFLLALSTASGSLLRNVSDSIFGNNLGRLPLAFGDFNADKLTDIFVLEDDGKSNTVSVLIATSQTFSIKTDKYFQVRTVEFHFLLVDRNLIKLDAKQNISMFSGRRVRTVYG